MGESASRSARLASVVAATLVAFACGTNYAYSAWGPSFASQLQFSTTQQNLIGVAGNMGQYAMGIPAGILVDSRGPRTGIVFGAIALGVGYYPLYRAYDAGPGAIDLHLASFFYFLTGLGSCTAFSAAIKTATYNWPQNRGTATAFPLSGFGLSAFLFATIAKVGFKGNTSGFLFLLTIGTLILNFSALYFIRLIPTTPLQSMSKTLPLNRKSEETAPFASQASDDHLDETSSLVSGRSSLEVTSAQSNGKHEFTIETAPTIEISGWRLFTFFEFWQLFGMMSVLAGIGLMTINNIGNDARALWTVWDPTAPNAFIQGHQQSQTAILSIGSFLGRLISGVGSDVLTKRLHASRIWCLTASACAFALSQALALMITNPNLLFLVSTLTGLSYGALFGTFPAIVADTFGISGLSLNWGAIIMAPVVSGNIYNVWYGRIFDANSDANGTCTRGIDCYKSAYWITLFSSFAGIIGSLCIIRWERLRALRASVHQRAV